MCGGGEKYPTQWLFYDNLKANERTLYKCYQKLIIHIFAKFNRNELSDFVGTTATHLKFYSQIVMKSL